LPLSKKDAIAIRHAIAKAKINQLLIVTKV
jgi:hypothetical protein